MVLLMVNHATGPISPAEAGTRKPRLNHLTPEEAATLEALADVLLPGSVAAGVAQYVDDQLGRDVPLLFLKYTDYNGPYDEFYKLGLQALDHESLTQFRQPFRAASPEQQIALVRAIAQTTPKDWNGPPATLFYFVLRNDAVDVYYGTLAGFGKLGVPYLALIQPPANW